MSPEDDIRRVADEYGVEASAVLSRVRPFLDSYLELVFAADSFEIVTGGRGLAGALAEASELESAAAAFLETDRCFPGAMLGLKLAVGAPVLPTLYHRCMLPMAVGARHVEQLTRGHVLQGRVGADLVARLPGVGTLYGLGFTEERGALRLKTYTLGAVDEGVGFRSLRLGPRGFEEDVREYTPDAASEGVAAMHAQRALGVDRFGHVARSKHRASKVYVERVGGIATDYAAI